MVHGSWFKRHKRATTLLFALLVMSTILITASSVSQLVALEMALARNNNDTLVATYAAESALEQGAYRVRNTSDTAADLNVSVSTPKVLNNQAAWSRSGSNNSAALVLLNFPKNLTRGFDFFNADNPGSGGKESIKITLDYCDSPNGDWIEVSYKPFSTSPYDFTGGTGGTGEVFTKIRKQCSPGANSVIIVPDVGDSVDISAGLAYRLYIRYVSGDSPRLSRMTVVGCTGEDGTGTCDLPGVVDISSVGTYRGASRTMDLVLPRLPPVTGVFDYGVFSECQIIKDPTNPNPSCY